MPIIRKMRAADIPAVERLLIDTWSENTRVARSCRQELEDMFSTAQYRPTFFVAEGNGKVIGCGAWNWSWLNYGTYEICWAAVRPEYRRRGIGRELVRRRLEDIAETSKLQDEREYLVMVSTHLVGAYTRYGFRSILAEMDGVDKESAHLMVMKITP